MKKSYLFSLLVALFLVLAGCASGNETQKQEQPQEQETNENAQEQVELTISAAASLQDALNELKGQFEQEHDHITLQFNYGASGSLQQQISQGAPVDLFFSAAEDKFDLLVDEGKIEEGIDLVGNSLVLIVPENADNGIKTFDDLPKASKISIGIPESVPAGKYAKDVLENMQIWNDIEEKIVFAKDVRQVLTYVETGNVEAGIVYQTDALSSDKIVTVATADSSTHDPIIYPLGIIKDSPNQDEAKLLYDFLQSSEALEVLKKYGFTELK